MRLNILIIILNLAIFYGQEWNYSADILQKNIENNREVRLFKSNENSNNDLFIMIIVIMIIVMMIIVIITPFIMIIISMIIVIIIIIVIMSQH